MARVKTQERPGRPKAVLEGEALAAHEQKIAKEGVPVNTLIFKVDAILLKELCKRKGITLGSCVRLLIDNYADKITEIHAATQALAEDKGSLGQVLFLLPVADRERLSNLAAVNKLPESAILRSLINYFLSLPEPRIIKIML